MATTELGRALLVPGGVLAALGAVLLLGARFGLGRVPGDLNLGGNGVRIHIPLATCVVLSVAATTIINLTIRR